jgi:hypothetical protein
MRQLPSFDLVTFPTLVGWLSGNGEVDTDRRQQTHSSSSILLFALQKEMATEESNEFGSLNQFHRNIITRQSKPNRILNVRRVKRHRGTGTCAFGRGSDSTNLRLSSESVKVQQVNKFEATPRPGNYYINRGREGYLFLDAHVTLPSLSLRVF